MRKGENGGKKDGGNEEKVRKGRRKRGGKLGRE